MRPDVAFLVRSNTPLLRDGPKPEPFSTMEANQPSERLVFLLAPRRPVVLGPANVMALFLRRKVLILRRSVPGLMV